MYFSLKLYSARKNEETRRSVNSQEPTLFKYPPCAVFAEISAYATELFGIPNAVPLMELPSLWKIETPAVPLILWFSAKVFS